MIDYKCPMCSHGHEYHLDPIGDGDTVETECDECGFIMEVTAFVSVDYETMRRNVRSISSARMANVLFAGE